MRLLKPKPYQKALGTILNYPDYAPDTINAAITEMFEQHYRKLSDHLQTEVSEALLNMKWDERFIGMYVPGTRPNPGFYADVIHWQGYKKAKETYFKGVWDSPVMTPEVRA